MTKAGLKVVERILDELLVEPELEIAPDIMKALKKDKQIWKNFQRFPLSYQRIRIAFIEGSRSRPEFFQKRLNYFLKITAKNKKFGMVQ